MIRPFLAYLLTGIVLLSQTGLPLHMHYCKGMLESVSVFFEAGCDDHEEIADLPACCQEAASDNCSKNDGKCCDDEVKVLLQNFESLLPHFDKWEQVATVNHSFDFPINSTEEIHSVELATQLIPDPGPPIYILCGSLIFYA